MYIKDLDAVKILVVEDDEILADLIRWRLKEMGYREFCVVYSGEEGIEKVKEYHPDLILMDITLEGDLDGVDAINEIRKTKPTLPVIYLSSHMEDEIIDRAILTKPSGYIAKPFEDFELNMAIKIALLKKD